MFVFSEPECLNRFCKTSNKIHVDKILHCKKFFESIKNTCVVYTYYKKYPTFATVTEQEHFVYKHNFIS